MVFSLFKSNKKQEQHIDNSARNTDNSSVFIDEGRNDNSVRIDESVRIDDSRDQSVRVDESVRVDDSRDQSVRVDESVRVDDSRDQSVRVDESVRVDDSRDQSVRVDERFEQGQDAVYGGGNVTVNRLDGGATERALRFAENATNKAYDQQIRSEQARLDQSTDLIKSLLSFGGDSNKAAFAAASEVVEAGFAQTSGAQAQFTNNITKSVIAAVGLISIAMIMKGR